MSVSVRVCQSLHRLSGISVRACQRLRDSQSSHVVSRVPMWCLALFSRPSERKGLERLGIEQTLTTGVSALDLRIIVLSWILIVRRVCL